MIAALRETAAGALVLLAATGLGRAAGPFLGLRPGFLAAAAGGLAAGATGIYALALAGLAYPVAGWAVAAGGIGCLAAGGAAPAPAGVPWTPGERALAGAVAVLVACGFVLAQVPPVTYDTVAYHLVLPQQQLLVHRATAMPWFVASALPYLVDAGYLWAQELGGEWRGPAVVNAGVGAAAAVAVFRLAVAAGLHRGAALSAALIWQTVPVVLLEAAAPLSDLAPCLYALLALTAFLRWWSRPRARGLAAVAVWAGLAGSCKYVSGLVLVPMLPVVAAVAGAGAAVTCCVLAAGVACPLLARTWLLDGSPLYPFLPASVQGAKIAELNRGISAVPRTAWNACSAPLRMAWEGERFAQRDLWQVGLVFTGMYGLPLFAWRAASGRDRAARGPAWLAAVAAAFWGLAFAGPWPVRYILVAAAICAVLLAALPKPSAGWPRAALLAILLAAVLPHARAVGAPLAWYLRAGADPDTYLGRLPPYVWPYRSCVFLREFTPPTARVLVAFEPQVYYARRRVYGSEMFDVSMLERLLAASADLPALLGRLRRLRITHVLIALGVDEVHARLYFRDINGRQMALLKEFLTAGADLLYQGPEAASAVYAVRRVDSRGR